MNLNFFCDIDGTLLPFGKGLPESARKAIEDAQDLGGKFFLATGRSQSEVPPELDEIKFSGGVYSNGTIAIYEGKRVIDISLERDEVEELLSYGEKNNFLLMLQRDDGTYMSKECLTFFRESMLRNLGRVIDVPSLYTNMDRKRDLSTVRKILVLSPHHEIDKLRKDYGERYDIVDNTVGLPQSDMAELCLKGYNKGTGIEALRNAVGMDKKTIVAIGDGANDIEMLSSVGLGIAMGNAPERVKSYASWVTSSVEEYGFKNAVEYAIKFNTR